MYNIRSKLSAKLYSIVISGIVITAVAIIISMYVSSSRIITDIVRNQATTTMTAILTRTAEMEKSSLFMAEHIAADSEVIKAIENNDKDALIFAAKKVLQELLASTDFVTISDAQGNVIGRTHSEKSGDSVLNQRNIQEAIKGKTSSYLEKGTEVKLSMRSSAPVKNADGEIIAAVSTGYRFDTEKFVDDLKLATGSEVTVFLHDERISTTIIQDGKRQIGTKLKDSIAKIVLEEKKGYIAEAEILKKQYYTVYEPILDSDRNSLGAFFSGLYIEDIKALEARNTVITIITVIPLSILIIFLSGFFINKQVVSPIKKMAALSQKLAEGNLDIDIISELNYSSSDEIGVLVKTYNNVVNSIHTQANELAAMADGDYSSQIEIRSNKDVMNRAINQLITSTNRMITEIRTSAGEVAAGSQEMAAGSQVLSLNATEQHNHCMVAHDLMTEGMNEINEMMAAMRTINESSENIKKITQLIHNISSQTHILAINSRIEAARAGENGKSFSVIADEIRSLAARSSSAARQTDELIAESSHHIEAGNRIVEKVTAKLQEVNNEITRVEEVVGETSSQAQQSAASAEEMSAQANVLTETISRIKLEK